MESCTGGKSLWRVAVKSCSGELYWRVTVESCSGELMLRVALGIEVESCSRELLWRVAVESCTGELYSRVAVESCRGELLFQWRAAVDSCSAYMLLYGESQRGLAVETNGGSGGWRGCGTVGVRRRGQ